MRAPFRLCLFGVLCFLFAVGCQKSIVVDPDTTSQQEPTQTDQSTSEMPSKETSVDKKPKAESATTDPQAETLDETKVEDKTEANIDKDTKEATLELKAEQPDPPVEQEAKEAQDTTQAEAETQKAETQPTIEKTEPQKTMVAVVTKPESKTDTETISKPDTSAPSHSVLVVGDSFAVGVGMTLAQKLKKYSHVTLAQKGKVSSGLNSPKFYNWEKKLSQFITEEKPDILVAMMSGNDAHNGSGSASWATSYETKMDSFLAIAKEKNVHVFLVGLPPMGKADYSKRATVANNAIKNSCTRSGICSYVDAWPLFTDKQGNYTRKKAINGKTKTLRAKDGVHFTMTGYSLLSQQIINSISSKYDISAKKNN